MNNEFGKQPVSGKKKTRPLTGGRGGKAGRKPADNFEWETDETVPDIYQAKKMALLYGITLDELLSFDVGLSEIQEAIAKTDEQAEKTINWTSAWGKKYPILLRYQAEVDAQSYACKLGSMLDELRTKYHYGEQDAMLVLKDILYKTWKSRKKNK